MAYQAEAAIKTISLHKLNNCVILFIANILEEINHFEYRNADETECQKLSRRGLHHYLRRKFNDETEIERNLEELSQKSKFLLKFWSYRFREATLQALFDYFDDIDRYDVISDISDKVRAENAVMNETESSKFDLLVINGLTTEDKIFAEWLVNHLEDVFSKRIFWPTRDGEISTNCNYEEAVEHGVIAIYSAEQNIEDPELYGNVFSHFTSEDFKNEVKMYVFAAFFLTVSNC